MWHAQTAKTAQTAQPWGQWEADRPANSNGALLGRATTGCSRYRRLSRVLIAGYLISIFYRYHESAKSHRPSGHDLRLIRSRSKLPSAEAWCTSLSAEAQSLARNTASSSSSVVCDELCDKETLSRSLAYSFTFQITLCSLAASSSAASQNCSALECAPAQCAQPHFGTFTYCMSPMTGVGYGY